MNSAPKNPTNSSNPINPNNSTFKTQNLKLAQRFSAMNSLNIQQSKFKITFFPNKLKQLNEPK